MCVHCPKQVGLLEVHEERRVEAANLQWKPDAIFAHVATCAADPAAAGGGDDRRPLPLRRRSGGGGAARRRLRLDPRRGARAGPQPTRARCAAMKPRHFQHCL